MDMSSRLARQDGYTGIGLALSSSELSLGLGIYAVEWCQHMNPNSTANVGCARSLLVQQMASSSPEQYAPVCPCTLSPGLELDPRPRLRWRIRGLFGVKRYPSYQRHGRPPLRNHTSPPPGCLFICLTGMLLEDRSTTPLPTRRRMA